MSREGISFSFCMVRELRVESMVSSVLVFLALFLMSNSLEEDWTVWQWVAMTSS